MVLKEEIIILTLIEEMTREILIRRGIEILREIPETESLIESLKTTRIRGLQTTAKNECSLPTLIK